MSIRLALIFPPANSSITTPFTLTLLPVAGIPRKLPRCVPVHVNRVTTFSPPQPSPPLPNEYPETPSASSPTPPSTPPAPAAAPAKDPTPQNLPPPDGNRPVHPVLIDHLVQKLPDHRLIILRSRHLTFHKRQKDLAHSSSIPTRDSHLLRKSLFSSDAPCSRLPRTHGRFCLEQPACPNDHHATTKKHKRTIKTPQLSPRFLADISADFQLPGPKKSQHSPKPAWRNPKTHHNSPQNPKIPFLHSKAGRTSCLDFPLPGITPDRGVPA